MADTVAVAAAYPADRNPAVASYCRPAAVDTVAVAAFLAVDVAADIPDPASDHLPAFDHSGPAAER